MVFLQAKFDIRDITKADVLWILGSTITFIKEMNNKNVLDWIRKMDKTTRFTTSVCSGSLILEAAGLLKNKKAVSHWKSLSLLTDFKAIPTSERVVEQDKYITAAGVSAGIDMALILTDKLVGALETKSIQLLIEYDPNPLYDAGSIEKASIKEIALATEKLGKDATGQLSAFEFIKYGKTLLKLR